MSVAVVLTLVAGYVDAIGFLRLGGIYVANMSGNSVAIGMHSALGPRATVLKRLLPVGAYMAGLLASRIAANLADRSHFQRIVAVCLAAEIVCLVLFEQTPDSALGIVLAALAMGIQAAAIVRFSGVSVYTAFVTGSLVKLADNLAEAIVNSSGNSSVRLGFAVDAVWFAFIWLAYVGGAACGAAAFTAEGARVVIWSCLVLAVIAVGDLINPRAVGSFQRRV